MLSTPFPRKLEGRMISETRLGLGRRIATLVRDVDRLLDRMGHENEGLLLVLHEAEQILLELAPGLFVDCRERFIHQQDLGVDGKGTCQPDPLAHAARELVRIGILEAGQADLPDVAFGDRIALGARHAAQFQPEGHVANDAGPRQQGEILEDKCPIRARSGDLSAVNLDLTGRGFEQARDDLKERGLATARRAKQ